MKPPDSVCSGENIWNSQMPIWSGVRLVKVPPVVSVSKGPSVVVCPEGSVTLTVRL